MTDEQKAQLNELLEALKKADRDVEIYVEAENDGLWSGLGVVLYEKGEHHVEFHRNFELYSQTLEGGYEDTAEDLIKEIENCINENDYDLFTELMNTGDNWDWEIISTDSYDFSDELQSHSMDDEEVPEEILDDDEEISASKLEENGWTFGVLGGGTSLYNANSTEIEDLNIELNSFTIKFDDKSFTFQLD